MICDLRKISEPTEKLFNEYQSKLVGNNHTEMDTRDRQN